MKEGPFTFDLQAPDFIPSQYDNHIKRNLSNMAGQYLDQDAFKKKQTEEDSLLYEVYELKRPEVAGEILHGISIVHPGKIGDEYYMTKGHYHTILETAEIYYTLKGEGVMVMETPEGDWAVEKLVPGGILYVPPRWAHRSVNIGVEEDLVMFFAYPGDAGHNYATIETQGFRKLILEIEGNAEIVDNPRWSAPEK
ncbi:MAG: glucose-6-phosphate isomerase [Anaerolineales bacterium]|nr:glucose-6-phosphate isomerase [Anaerolineales bacterium]